MLLCSPIVASPTYDRCGTLLPAPTSPPLSSTYVPTWTPSCSTVPGRRYANGPIVTSAPIFACRHTARSTVAPGPTVVSRSVVCGPITAPAATAVVPCRSTDGSNVTSRSSVTPASTQAVAGSTTVTPARMCASSGGELHSVVHPGGLVVCGDHGAHRLPLAHQDGHDVRQVLLALGIVRGELAERVA